MKKTHFPENFIVSDQIIKLAKENGWVDPRKEVDAFKDYHLAHGSLMANWEAAFRTWLRNAQKWSRLANKQANPPIPPKPPVKPAEARPQEVAKVRDLLSELVNKFDVRKKA